MTNEQLKAICDAWITAEPQPDEDGYYGDAELRNAGFRLEHAGRYVLTVTPKSFGAEDFDCDCEGDDGAEHSLLWTTLTSSDENYYHGDIQLQSKPAYDVALLGEALREAESFDDASAAFAVVFATIGKRDYRALDSALTAGGITTGEKPGELVMEEIPNVVGSLTVFPA